MRTSIVEFEYELERDEENFEPKTILIEIEILHDNESYDIVSFKPDFEISSSEEIEIEKYFDEHFGELVKSEEEERDYYYESRY